MLVAMSSHPGPLQLGLMFGLAVLFFKRPTIITWLGIAIFTIVLGLFRLA
jgi:hypothetical protein